MLLNSCPAPPNPKFSPFALPRWNWDDTKSRSVGLRAGGSVTREGRRFPKRPSGAYSPKGDVETATAARPPVFLLNYDLIYDGGEGGNGQIAYKDRRRVTSVVSYVRLHELARCLAPARISTSDFAD